MRPRPFGIAAFVLALCTVFAFLYAKRPHTSSADSEHASVATVTPVPNVPLDARAVEPALELDSADIAPAVAAQLARAEAVPEDAQELWIIEKSSRAPVVGADVRFVDFDDVTHERWFPRWGRVGLGGGARHIAEQGRPFTSDARGLARLPKAKGRGIALARKGELFGMWWFDANDPRPSTLELEPDQDWVVRVTDVAGRPIPQLRMWLQAAAAPTERPDTLVVLRTDELGVARVEHARWFLAYQQAERFLIAPDALLRTDVAVALDGRVPPENGSELVLPEVGLVTVRVLDPDGNALPPGDPSYGGHRVWLRDAATERPAPLHAAPGCVRIGADDSGSHRMYVQVGLDLEAVHQVTSMEGATSVRAPGPRAPLEPIDIPIRIGGQAPLLRLRVLDAGGEPAANRVLRVSSRRTHAGGGGGGSAPRRHRTDERGVLVLPLEPQRRETRTVIMLDANDDAHQQAVVVVPQSESSGWIDVGDVRLQSAPVLVAGVVTDETGRPFGGASIHVEGALKREYRAPDSDDADLREIAQQMEVQLRFTAGLSWNLKSAEDGRFELRALPLVEGLQLAASSGDRPASDAVQCAPGTVDLRIALIVGGALEGRVLLPPELPAKQLALELSYVQSGDTPGAVESATPELDPNGSWSARGLRPGRWHLKVSDRRVFAWEPLVPGVFADVTAGTTQRAPDIDLGAAALRRLVVDVVGESGAAVAGAEGTFHGRGSGNNNDVEVLGGKATLLTRHAVVDAWFGAPGHRCAKLEDVQDGARVVLRPDLAVRLQLRDTAALPMAPFELCVSLDPGLGTQNYVLGELSRSSQVRFDAGGSALLAARFVGEHSAMLSVRALQPDGQWRFEWVPQGEPSQSLRVRDLAELQAFALDIDPAAVRAAVEKLRAQ